MVQLNFCHTCGMKRVRDVKQQLESLFDKTITYKPNLCGICFKSLRSQRLRRKNDQKFAEDEESLTDADDGITLEGDKQVQNDKVHSQGTSSLSEEEADKSEIQSNSSHETDDDSEFADDNSRKKTNSKSHRSDLQSIISDLDPRVLEFMSESDDFKQSFKCKFCEKKFAYANSFVHHLKTHPGVETIEKPYKCNLCDARFVRRFNLKTHGRKHSDDRPFKCSYPPCTASFKDKHTLAGHEETHTGAEKPHVCEFCSKAFRKRTVLETHKRIHTGDKPYMCKFCGFCCTQKQNLVTHERQHTEVKPFRCKVCDKGFYQMIQLQRHEMDHTGARPYVCEICGHACKAKSYLKQHMDIHRTERPYKCDRCDFTSKRKENIRSHQKVHSTEKAFQCKHCSKMFKHKDSLKKHERRHFREPGGGYVQVQRQRKAKRIPELDTKPMRLPGNEPTSVRTLKDPPLTIGNSSCMERLPHLENRMLIPPHQQGYSTTFNTMGMMPHHHVTPHTVTQTTTQDYEPVDVVFNIL